MTDSVNHKQIWLAPICHEDGDGRQWCQDDVWGDDCGCGMAEHQSVRYVLAADHDRVAQERDTLRAEVERLRTALRLAKPCVERDMAAAVKENFGYVGDSDWACSAVDARNAIDASLSGSEE